MFNNGWNSCSEQKHSEVIKKTLSDCLILSMARNDIGVSNLPKIPVVTSSNNVAFPTLDSVGNDCKGKNFLALDHFNDLEHRRTGLVVGDSRIKTLSVRLDTYQKFHTDKK